MAWQDLIAGFSVAKRLDRLATAEGEAYGPKLLEKPPSAWRALMRGDPHFRSYGTLQFLLEAARARFEVEPSVAREITAAVLDFVDEVTTAPSHIHKLALRGQAWKEHANALCMVGDLVPSLSAAERAVAVYGESAVLYFDQTKARLTMCNIYREMGETESALTIARECAAIFLDYADYACRTMARTCEGVVLATQKRFAEALEIFNDLVEEAELAGDTLTLARALQNAAECARELGDIEGARDLYPRALAHFEAMNLPTEATRVRWGYALSLAAEAKTAAAVSELFKVRAVYLHLGMNADAATAALDIVRIRFEADEDVRGLCGELVATFASAGMTQNAIEALAYLREQARHDVLTGQKIIRVRTYFDELSRRPSLLFRRPDVGGD